MLNYLKKMLNYFKNMRISFLEVMIVIVVVVVVVSTNCLLEESSSLSGVVNRTRNKRKRKNFKI